MNLFSLVNPFKTYITIALLLISFGSGVYVTHKVYSGIRASEEYDRNKALLKATEKALERENALAEALKAAQGKTKTIVKEVEVEVTKEVYRCELPSDGRKLLNDAVTEANNATGQPSLPEAE